MFKKRSFVVILFYKISITISLCVKIKFDVTDLWIDSSHTLLDLLMHSYPKLNTMPYSCSVLIRIWDVIPFIMTPVLCLFKGMLQGNN